MNFDELKILNRIELLKSRKAENGNIIKKQERKLRRIRGERQWLILNVYVVYQAGWACYFR